MIKGPSIKLPTRRLSQLSKTPSKPNKRNDKDVSISNPLSATPSLGGGIQMESIDDVNSNNSNNSNNSQLSIPIKENLNPNNISMNNNYATSPRQRLSISSSIDRDNINNNNNMMQVDTDNDDETLNSNSNSITNPIEDHIANHMDDDYHSEETKTETEFVESCIKNTENIQCMVRIRPLLTEFENRGRVCVDLNESNNMITIDCKPKPKSFTFDHVGSMRSTQESIFQSVGKPITNACLSGYNGTIFAYGQTGSGKTFTILGIISTLQFASKAKYIKNMVSN